MIAHIEKQLLSTTADVIRRLVEQVRRLTEAGVVNFIDTAEAQRAITILEDFVRDADADCYMKAKAKGEPTFTLRAQDVTAALMVDGWVEMNKFVLGDEHPKIVGARAIAAKMRDWPKKKQAD